MFDVINIFGPITSMLNDHKHFSRKLTEKLGSSVNILRLEGSIYKKKNLKDQFVTEKLK